MMVKQVISTDKAPAAIGPYSQAIKAGGFLFLSGQIPIDPKTGQLITSGIAEQTRQVLKNLEQVLIAAGATLKDVVKTTIFLANMGDFAKVNETYAEFFPEGSPARATVEVSRLPKNVGIEIEAIAIVE